MFISGKISIVGKNELVREGLRRILSDAEFEIVNTVSTHADLENPEEIDICDHVVLCDAGSGSEAVVMARALRARLQNARIVLMVDEFSIENVAAAFGEGIDGYVVKAISCEPLISALRFVASGEKVFPSQIALALTAPVWKLTPGNWDTDSDLNLSGREIEILRCLVSGDSNKIIARRLQITEATVKVHVKAVLRKLRVSNRTQAAIWAFTRGLTQEDRPQVEPELDYFPLSPARTRPQLRVAV